VVRSMTGYGDASAQVGGTHYFVEVRSLNNKYFKATIRLAEAYQGLEAEIESRLRERLTRGTITVTARCTDSTEAAAYEINERALLRYMDRLGALATLRGIPVQSNAADLLALPGVLQPSSSEEDLLRAAREAFLPLIDQAVVKLVAMRAREGAVLADEVRSHLSLIERRLGEVTERAPAVIAEYEARLRSRINTLFAEAGQRVEPVELIREIAVYAERTDIAEEIKRLSAHVDQFRELLSQPDPKPVGRTLDFLSQEMLREANTIASKSPDAGISRAIVEIKGAIDRVKEQVQNLE
jgi:uncharacterized protein (TIGR00255 family)